MYIPTKFRIETEEDTIGLLRDYPFGALISHGPQGFEATHLPFLAEKRDGTWYLTGHMAKANPHRASFASTEAFVIFSGPHSHISPTWYQKEPAVPTWNYVAVHASGIASVFDDSERVAQSVRLLSAQYEKNWSFDELPEAFRTANLGAIIGVEVKVVRLEAKAKLSQNRPEADQETVATKLEDRGFWGDKEIAVLMRGAAKN